jgi:hypothetical protein
MAQRQLSHGVGGGLGGVADGNAVLLGILDVDVVDAYAAADDELELALASLVDVVGPDLGLGADYYGVEILKSLSELIGFIELFYDIVSELAKYGESSLIHSVGNKNSHFESPYL